MLRQAQLRRLVFAFCLACVVAPAAAQDLRVGGTGSALGTMRLLADAHARKEAGFRLVVVPNLGSSGGLGALRAGAVDVAVTGRALKPEEAAAGLVAYEYGRSPFVLVTSMKNVRELSRAAVAGMLSGATKEWPDGTPVRVVLRPASDADTALLGALSPEIGAALKLARAREGLVVGMTDQDAAGEAERLPGSLATNTLALLLSEQRTVHVLALDGVLPSVKALADGRYPHHKQLFVVTRAGAGPAVERFVAFIKSPQGRAVLETNGHVVPH